MEGLDTSSATWTRRGFLGAAALAGGAALVRPASLLAGDTTPTPRPAFEISLAAWSLHRMFFGKEVDQLGMVQLCRERFDIGAFEMVNTMWPSPTAYYCGQLKKRADDLGVRLLLIMCDGEGNLAATDRAERHRAVRNHHKWVDVAAQVGCRAIRCNVGGAEPGDADAVVRAAESFQQLVAYAKPSGIRVLVENHGGRSSDPAFVVELMKWVDDRWFGTLPDFGNFPAGVDKYAAIAALMPYAGAVSAKCYDFDDATGEETTIDFARMLGIVTAAGYHRHVGIEYEGDRLDEATGIQRAKALLEKLAKR